LVYDQEITEKNSGDNCIANSYPFATEQNFPLFVPKLAGRKQLACD